MRQLLKSLAVLILSGIFLSLSLSFPAHADIKLVPFASGFTLPVDIANAGDGSQRMFVVEQIGRIRSVKNGFVQPTTAPFLDLQSIVQYGGERGLLGLAFHPNYASNGQFFVYYTSKARNGLSTGDIVVERYTRRSDDPTLADPASALRILTIAHTINDNHNGGSMRFGPDGFLYIGVGDGGGGGDPFGSGQNLNSLLGKILRINVTGVATYTVPANNPFVGVANTKPEIWAYGIRNPWRISFDRGTGELFIADVGQGDWEEVNRQAAGFAGGANYGWKNCEGLHAYPPTNPVTACALAGAVPPILEYSHSDGVSITGGYVYRGQSTPDLVGKYVFGDYSRKLWYTALSPAAKIALAETPQVSTFGESQAGELFLADIGAGTVQSFSSSADVLPDPVIFDPVNNVPISSVVTSQLIKITGLGTPAQITISGGEYTASTTNSTSCSSSYTTSSAAMGTDTYVCLRHTSSSSNGTPKTTTFTVGASTFTFVSNTVAGAPTFTVTPSLSGNGFISPNTPQTVTSGLTAQFQITPVAGNTVAVTGTCGGTLNGTNYNTNAVTANCTVIATFTANTYMVTPSAGTNGSITPNTVQNITQGATTTFTVTPNSGYSASVGGTCGGNLSGAVYTTAPVTAACTVAATFALVPVVPGAPTIGTAIAGDGLIAVGFTPPAANGGSAITHYVGTCNGTSMMAAQSPIIVSGLNNGTSYACTVTAVNAVGASAPSTAVNSIPDANAPLQLIAVQSRKAHGVGTNFDLQIDNQQTITGPISVEPRLMGNFHRIVFQFNVPINDDPAVTAEDAAAAPYAGATRATAGTEVTVTLPGIADGQRVKLTLPGVNAVNLSSLTGVSASIGFMVGDIDGHRSVNASDISAIKARATPMPPPITLSNFRFDLDKSGAVDAADLTVAKARSGKVIP
ncbi:MAG: PQQ-dependent sugar dehydrogenase [Betaproteobacteria bacterium]